MTAGSKGRGGEALWLAAPLLVLGPAWMRHGPGVPGAARSDLWNSLWTLWHTWRAPLGATRWLNYPVGGLLPPADPVNALLMGPLLPVLGPAWGWTLLVWGHLALAGWATAGLARALGAPRAGAALGGLAMMTAPVLTSGIHNGTSEAVGWGWLPLALWAVQRALQHPVRLRVALAAVALSVAGLSSWYVAVCAWMAAVVLCMGHPGWRRGLTAVALASVIVAPWAVWVQYAATAADNLVGIKDPMELALIRRTIGATDPRVLFTPGDFRSPDFRRISRYGEDFIHCAYLGWVWLAAAVVGLRAGAPRRWVGLGVLALALSCGPVLVAGGAPVLLPGDLGVPLPYLALEWLPGFASLSLVYRLAGLGALALAVTVAFGVRRWRVAALLGALGWLEMTFLAPVAGTPAISAVPTHEALQTLAGLDGEGAVMNHPVVGGRAYLYEATVHGRPLAATLNFPTNKAAEKVWKALRSRDLDGAVRTARARGIRYIVFHEDSDAEPGPYAVAAAFARERLPVVAAEPGLEVVALW